MLCPLPARSRYLEGNTGAGWYPVPSEEKRARTPRCNAPIVHHGKIEAQGRSLLSTTVTPATPGVSRRLERLKVLRRDKKKFRTGTYRPSFWSE